MFNYIRPELDAETRYYYRQRDKAVKIALSKIYGGKILHPAQKGAPEIHRTTDRHKDAPDVNQPPSK